MEDSTESVFSDLTFSELTIRESVKRAEMYVIPARGDQGGEAFLDAVGHTCVGEVKLCG